jgi:predicted AAA+ superfamily ATPase
LLASTYMLETIPPYFSNLGKRLIKAPKIYIADAGITAALLGLHSYEEMLGHPSYGTLWEQIVLINLRGWLPHAEIFHYRTANGAEIDFVVQTRNALYALECKASSAPTLSKGNYLAFADVQPKKTFVVCPVSTGWPLSPGIDVVSLGQLKALIAPTYCDTLG